jgi:hypothetical protein
MRELRPHQQHALAWARERDRIALFMEMRCGKSSVAIQWAQERLPERGRVLLVSPLQTLPGRLQWEGELAANGITDILPLYDMAKDAREAHASWRWVADPLRPGAIRRRRASGWFLAHYQALMTNPELLDMDWDVLILDESTRVRNPQAQLTKLLLKRATHIPRRALLSGLPNPESPLDLFTQFQILHGDFDGWTSYWAYRQTKFSPGWSGYDWRPKPGVSAEIKQYLQAHAYILSRQEADIGGAMTYAERFVEQNAEQRRLLKDIQDRFALGDKQTQWAGQVHQWLSQVSSGIVDGRIVNPAKLHELTTLLEGDLRGQPVVVWFAYNEQLETAYAYLQKHAPERKPVRLYAELAPKPRQRQDIQEAFHDGRYDVLLIQIQLGKFGWNLSNADTNIYFSNSYEYEARAQSQDRIIHPLKRTPCLTIDLITKGTLNEEEVHALRDKKTNANVMLKPIYRAQPSRSLRVRP